MIRSGLIVVIYYAFKIRDTHNMMQPACQKLKICRTFSVPGSDSASDDPLRHFRKPFIEKRTALEFIVAPQFDGAPFTGLIEFHRTLRRPGIYCYSGFGADVGRFAGDQYGDYDGDHYTTEGYVTAVAIDGVIGAEANA